MLNPLISIPNPGEPGYEYYLHLSKIVEEIRKETDRGAALFSASVLDNLLEEIIAAYLVPGKGATAILKGGGGQAPIGSLSTRISAALALGLITDQEYVDCHIVRKIRNEFAHNAEFDLKFDNQKIKDLVMNINILGPIIQDHRRSELPIDNKSIREFFSLIVFTLYYGFNLRLRYAKAHALKADFGDWYKNPLNKNPF